MLASSKQSERRITKALRQYLLSMSTRDMVRKIMSGVRKDEVALPPEHHRQQLHELVAQSSQSFYLKSAYPFYLDPMPNLYFTRDPAAAKLAMD